MAEEEAARRGRRYRNIASMVVLAVAVAFVISTAWQITASLFGLTDERVAPHGPPAACVEGIRGLAAGLDRASVAAASARTEEEARQTFATSVKAQWTGAPAVEAACAADRHGTDAYTALLRLRRVMETETGDGARAVAPLRAELEGRLH